MSELRKAAKNILDYADWILKEQDTPPPCNLRNATESLRKALDQGNTKPMRKLTADEIMDIKRNTRFDIMFGCIDYIEFAKAIEEKIMGDP